MKNISELLNKLAIPSINIRCYGRHITITCKSQAAIHTWHKVLSKFAAVRGVIETREYHTVNKNTVLNPSSYKCFRIYAAIR